MICGMGGDMSPVPPYVRLNEIDQIFGDDLDDSSHYVILQDALR